jgi:phosphatidylglycerophosphatase C
MAPQDDDTVQSSGSRPALGAEMTLAVFDFDGTLTRGGSVWRFLASLRGRRQVALAAFPVLPKLLGAAIFGGTRSDAAKEALFRRTLGGLPAEEVASHARGFGVSHYERHARSDTRERLEWHRAQGHRLLIVSASPGLLLDGVAELLQVDAAIGTRLAVDAKGHLTGTYEGENCRGAQKILRVHAWIADARGTPIKVRSETSDDEASDHEDAPPDPTPFIWAYGNSAGDRQLLAGANRGVDVGRLGRFGKLRRFTRLRSVHPRQVSRSTR